MGRIENFFYSSLEFIRENLFSTVFATVLTLIFLSKVLFEGSNGKIDENLINNFTRNEIQVFVQDNCTYCDKLKRFVESKKIKEEYVINYYNLNKKESVDLILQQASIHGLSVSAVGTPAIFTKEAFMIGFDEKKFLDFLENSDKYKNSANQEEFLQKTIKIPFYGEINFFNLSLPLLTIIVGLADGFNPCAMWVLVYLLSITISLKDKKKIWLLVGSFVFSSGVLYFLFMTAWLNVFLFVGYLRILNLVIGFFAIYFGTMTIRDYVKNNGNVVCKLENNKTRKESMGKVRAIIEEKLSLRTIFAVMFLAFVVNSIEFVCSSALPATYTYLITRANLSSLQYYLYMLLYTFMFMLDDLIVFSVAAFTLNNYTGKKYESYSAIIGGSVMLIIGIFIVFFPNLLK